MAEYDYVIVGAGSAGCALANRLSAEPGTRVLLLEAGGSDRNLNIRIPVGFAKQFRTDLDWGYSSEPEPNLIGRSMYLPRGRSLGGSSSMNAMIYLRGHKSDFDNWATSGAPGWSYAEVLPYFKRSENNERIGNEYHGKGGELNVADPTWTSTLTEPFVESAAAVGIARNDDFNGAEQEGAGPLQLTQKRGRRWSAADAFLHPVKKQRENLTVATKAHARKVLIENGRAVGVQYASDKDGLQTARAGREVIVAAGAINSPQLLMLSGIGPADHLREHGIDVVENLPGVGQNLHDHTAVPCIWHTKGTTDVAEFNNLVNFARAKATGKGPLVSNIGEAGGFFRTRDELGAPDLQVHVAPSGFWDNGLHEPTTRKVTVAPTLVSVASRGRLRLRSTDPQWHPDIDPAYYDDPTDLDAMVAGVQRLLETVHTGPIARFVDRPFLPSSSAPTEGEIVEHLRANTQTLYHPVGTCAMGTGEQAVVDPELRVRGVEGLRVVDASVMPVVPRGNTNAPTIMVGEKAADLVRGRTHEKVNR